ncbi:MAG: hypothetical protein AB2A00_39695 [Myxococcota bacterium]
MSAPIRWARAFLRVVIVFLRALLRGLWRIARLSLVAAGAMLGPGHPPPPPPPPPPVQKVDAAGDEKSEE